ncbi:MAG: glycosyltransferase family 39 protein [Methanoregula sp.]|nr:glycosyltransferase family 39 protein [Methanoregula sp.]
MRIIINKSKIDPTLPDKISDYLPAGENLRSKNVTYFIYFNSMICGIFFLLLGYGYYYQDSNLLSTLNILKYILIPMLGFSIYEAYKFKKINFLFPIIGALILLWFIGFDFAYRWDAIQHVARAKFFMEHDFFGSSERNSFLYLIWGFAYRIWGESEIITHLTNMILGLAGMLGIFFIAKEIYNEFVGIIALIISLTLPAFFLVNKEAYLDMPFVSFVVFTFLFLINYLKTKNEFFLILTLLFAFLSTGIKEPGIIIFPIIGIILYKFNRLSKFNFITLVGSMLISLYYIFFTFLTKPKTSLVFTSQSEFSIVTPLRYGFDAIFIWAGSATQEICQILYTGLLFVGILAIFHKSSNKIFYYVVIFAEMVLLSGMAFFPPTEIFYFPVIPVGNYYFYLSVFLILIIVISSLYLLKKIRLTSENHSLILLLWMGIFLLFFLINTKLYGYGIKNPLDVSALDFRYLLPAFPPLIILFSKGISNILDLKDQKIRILGLLILSLLIIINILMSLNLAFFFANSGNTHLEGYKYAQSISENNIIYTQWPFAYSPEGNFYDIGQYSWNKDNSSYKSIYSDTFEPGSAILGSSHFFQSNKFVNLNFTTITSKSLYLNPLLPKISEKTIDSVSIGIIPGFLISLSDGFYGGENWNSVTTYWMKNDSKIKILSPKNSTVTLTFIAQSFSHPRTLDLYTNGNFIISKIISTSPTNVMSEISIISGENVIYLHTAESCERPIDVPILMSTDQRCLSIAIQKITITDSNV